MSWDELLSATALEQAQLVRRRVVSSEELVRLYLERSERLDPLLDAYVARFPRRALRAARDKDRAVRAGEPLPPLHGVPLGIKDLNLVRFSVTHAGTRTLPGLLSPVDDRTTASLRRAGLVIVGKLATSEFGAMPVTEPDGRPPTRNPWDRTRTSGGSSGGSGAAVAAGLVPIAHGSDGAGSIRIPSSFCHVYGFKPSRGLVRNAFGYSDTDILYTDGPLARDVLDAAAMVDALCRRAWRPLRPAATFLEATRRPPRRLRIGLTTTSALTPTAPEIEDAVRSAAVTIASLGHEVEELPFPEATLAQFLPLWQRQVAVCPAPTFSRAQPVTRWLGEAGRRLTAQQVQARQRALTALVLDRFAGFDIWMTPTVGIPPPLVGAFGNDRPPAEAFADAARLGAFTAPFNVTGQPAASLPIGIDAQGLPMGLQLAGPRGADHLVLALSRQIEEALPWRGRLDRLRATLG